MPIIELKDFNVSSGTDTFHFLISDRVTGMMPSLSFNSYLPINTMAMYGMWALVTAGICAEKGKEV